MPAWVKDDDIWAKAKEAALESHDEDDDGFWAIVTTIYKKMHGRVDSAKAEEPLDVGGGKLIYAAGTSEGARKGWEEKVRFHTGEAGKFAAAAAEKRKSGGMVHGVLDSAKATAHRSSAKAYESGKAEDHKAAASAHHRAASLHSRIDYGKEQHKEYAKKHEDIAAMIGKISSEEPGVDEAVVMASWSDAARAAALEARNRIDPSRPNTPHEYASILSKKANEFSAKHQRSRRFDDNDDAMDLHEKAAQAHEAIGNKAEAERHNKAFMKHANQTREALQQRGYRGEATEPDIASLQLDLAHALDGDEEAWERVEAAMVTAGGTSEGARKGWEDRKRAAWSASEAADRATSAATKANTFASHEKAKRAHADAATAHGDVAGGYDESSHHFQVHDSNQRYHESMAAEHEDKQNKMRASENSDNDSAAVRCRDVGIPFIITARRTLEVGKPFRSQWMPGGVSIITASYGRGEDNSIPIELAVKCDEAGARRIAESFKSIRAANPRRPPYICIEHKAKERAGEPIAFEWAVDPEPGIYMTFEPSALGASNVNGRVHESFSPTFDTDADYSVLRCTECEGSRENCKDGKCGQCGKKTVFVFKAGARGSRENPAVVTRLDPQSVGSLTNWNAFREILPIAAREPDGSVKAGGTSEGAKKGWEQRKQFSADANKAGEDYNKEFRRLGYSAGEEEHHHLAAYAQHASNLHEKAALAHEERKGGEDAAAGHRYAKDFFGQAAAHHKMKAEGKIAGSDQELDDSVKAGGTSEGAKKGWQYRARDHKDEAYRSMQKSYHGQQSNDPTEAAQGAYDATRHADKSDRAADTTKTKDDLLHASQAHGHAKEAHQAAFEATNSGHHKALSEYHSKRSEQLMEAHRAVVKTSETAGHGNAAVQAEWSDAARKAAAEARRTHAISKSKEAFAASRRYQDQPGSRRYGDDKRTAVAAHKEAAEAHEVAMHDAVNNGDHDAANDHKEAMKYHDEAAAKHSRGRDIDLSDPEDRPWLITGSAADASHEEHDMNAQDHPAESIHAQLADRINEPTFAEAKVAGERADDASVKAEEVVMATWSDAARKAAAEARDKGPHEELMNHHHGDFIHGPSSRTAAGSAGVVALNNANLAYKTGKKSHFEKARDDHNKAAELYDRAGNNTIAKKHWRAAEIHDALSKSEHVQAAGVDENDPSVQALHHTALLAHSAAHVAVQAAMIRANELGDERAARLLAGEARRHQEAVVAHRPKAGKLSVFARQAAAAASSALAFLTATTPERERKKGDLKAVFAEAERAQESVSKIVVLTDPPPPETTPAERVAKLFGVKPTPETEEENVQAAELSDGVKQLWDKRNRGIGNVLAEEAWISFGADASVSPQRAAQAAKEELSETHFEAAVKAHGFTDADSLPEYQMQQVERVCAEYQENAAAAIAKYGNEALEDYKAVKASESANGKSWTARYNEGVERFGEVPLREAQRDAVEGMAQNGKLSHERVMNEVMANHWERVTEHAAKVLGVEPASMSAGEEKEHFRTAVKLAHGLAGRMLEHGNRVRAEFADGSNGSVRAGGTSEGAKKGWENRFHTLAKQEADRGIANNPESEHSYEKTGETSAVLTRKFPNGSKYRYTFYLTNERKHLANHPSLSRADISSHSEQV